MTQPFISALAKLLNIAVLVAKGEENNSLAHLSLEDPVLDAAPSRSSHSMSTTATHQPCLLSKELF